MYLAIEATSKGQQTANLEREREAWECARHTHSQARKVLVIRHEVEVGGSHIVVWRCGQAFSW